MLERCVHHCADRAVPLTTETLFIFTVCRANWGLSSVETAIASNLPKTVARNPKLRKTVFKRRNGVKLLFVLLPNVMQMKMRSVNVKLLP